MPEATPEQAQLASEVVIFPLLADPGSYQASTFDYLRPGEGQPSAQDWCNVFRKSVPEFKRLASLDPAVPEAQRQAAAVRFAEEFEGLLQQLEADPAAELAGHGSEPLSCVRLCALRDACLRGHGFADCFKGVKADEDAKALALLPSVLRDLDSVADHGERLELALRGVFAGNIFDLGAAASTALFNSKGGVSFVETRATLLSRPWAIDNLDPLLQRFSGRQYEKAILFCDNAGADVVLGMLPFARELLKRGTVVVLAANETPCINDITAAELEVVVQLAAVFDKVIGRALVEEALSVVSSGTDLPVIDLSKVSRELAEEAQTADFVVLEGMGRAIETNLHAQFVCDSLKLGMIKHPEVASCLKGRLFDVVCKFDVGSSSDAVTGTD